MFAFRAAGGGCNHATMNSCDHLVEFVGSDDRLIARAADFLIEGFARGSTCITVITEDHRQRLDRALLDRGTQTERLAASYRYVFVDAEVTLASLMSAGRFNAEEFHHTFGGLLRLTASGGKSVCIVGEMVSLLAQKGDQRATIQLEEAWNELSRVYAFNLFCLYSLAALPIPMDAAHRHHIRSIHSRELTGV